jgi:hypothetical protein
MIRHRLLRCLVAAAFCILALPGSAALADDPLLDWSDWERYRDTVQRPCLSIKPADIARARENIQLYDWAKEYLVDVERRAKQHVEMMDEKFIRLMIPQTTPLGLHFNPCPACRDKDLPWHPQGEWDWRVERPTRLTCRRCKTVYPNKDYPETIEVKSSWGVPQTFTYYGGEPFKVFSYPTGRPSFTGVIRAHQVAHMSQASRQLAEAYVLTGDVQYAELTRRVLLRFAEVYPNWLVHVGYGEYADMDPKVAAMNIGELPADELVYPPNKPDRLLHTQHWTAGRAQGSGFEGNFLRPVALAYDLTASARRDDGTSVYSDEEQRKVERDLLLEATVLLVAQKRIDNKAISGRTGCALVGATVGHPGLVRYGLEGFTRTIDEWYLPDGATPESPSYGARALREIDDIPIALEGYSDPPGYRNADGKRLDNLNLYRDSNYTRVADAYVNMLQGDLSWPGWANAYPGFRPTARQLEIMATKYPDRPRYLALLKEVLGPDLAKGDAATALYLRPPGMEEQRTPPFSLPDWNPPELRIAHLRTGEHGRESLVLLSASHWGAHHHIDSLNIYYWKNGQELLTDLGYLWDNPNKGMTARTLAHNTVLIDEQDQETVNRGGEILFFHTSPHFKSACATSRAYPSASTYARSIALIDHGDGRSYLVDLFRVHGGATQDYVFHGPHSKYDVELPLSQTDRSIYDFTNVRTAAAEKPWRASWEMEDSTIFTAWCVPGSGETVFVGDGWGQRDSRNADIGRTIPYIVRRTAGSDPRAFVSVFASSPEGQPFVKSVEQIASDERSITIKVTTSAGHEQLTLSLTDGAINATSVSEAGETRWQEPKQ